MLSSVLLLIIRAAIIRMSPIIKKLHPLLRVKYSFIKNTKDVLKKIKIDDQYVHLIPLNSSFEPMTVRKRDVTLIWKVVKVIKNL